MRLTGIRSTPGVNLICAASVYAASEAETMTGKALGHRRKKETPAAAD